MSDSVQPKSTAQAIAESIEKIKLDLIAIFPEWNKDRKITELERIEKQSMS